MAQQSDSEKEGQKVKPNRFIECAPRLSPSDINEVEQRLGFTIPSALRLHYLTYNGGEPRRRWFRGKAGFEDSVERFLPMKHKTFDDEELLEENYINLCIDTKRIPATLLPFAEDEGGNPYCLNLENQQVVFFNMARETEPDRATRAVATTLESFIEGMLSHRDFYRGKNSA